MLLYRIRSPLLRGLVAIAESIGAIMATTFKWTALTDRSASTGGTVSTELNSLASGAFSAVSGIFDNTANQDEWAEMVVELASLTPTAGAYLQLFDVNSHDGTNFEDAPSATNPGSHQLLGTASLTTGAGTKRAIIVFRMPPGKTKWVIKNNAGVAFAASGNTAKLWTFNEQGV